MDVTVKPLTAMDRYEGEHASPDGGFVYAGRSLG